jgi:hypothetical protein
MKMLEIKGKYEIGDFPQNFNKNLTNFFIILGKWRTKRTISRRRTTRTRRKPRARGERVSFF